MSAARRVRSAAISRWRMPISSSSSARARSVRPTAPASATSRRKPVININGDLADALHYNNTLALRGRHLRGDRTTLRDICAGAGAANKAEWLDGLRGKEGRMDGVQARALRRAARSRRGLAARRCCTQPAAIKIVADLPRAIDAAKFFDAGDVQANGFQIVEDDRPAIPSPKPVPPTWALPRSALLASGARRQAALRHRLLRRRLLHDEPADPDRRASSTASRHDRDLRQSPHGGDHRVAARAVRRAISGTNDSVAVDYVQLALGGEGRARAARRLLSRASCAPR